MEQGKDYIEREIQRLSLVLSHLISKAFGLFPENSELGIQNIESDLKNEFDLSLRELSQMNNSELLDTIHRLHNSHIEQLVELIVILVKNSSSYPANKLASKGLLMLNYLEKHSEIFSLKRVSLKNQLQDFIQKNTN